MACEEEELSKAAKAKLEKVERMTSEYVQVMLLLGNLDVFAVSKVINEDLDMQFTIAVSGVEDLEMLKVLHGTSTASVDAIVREGFKVGGDEVPVRHGTAHGTGVYLTTDPHMAAGYSRRRGCKYIILSELCRTAECVTRNPNTAVNSLPVLLTPETKKKETLYTVYVQPNKALVRPLYVVEFCEIHRSEKGVKRAAQPRSSNRNVARKVSSLNGLTTVPAPIANQAPAPRDNFARSVRTFLGGVGTRVFNPAQVQAQPQPPSNSFATYSHFPPAVATNTNPLEPTFASSASSFPAMRTKMNVNYAYQALPHQHPQQTPTPSYSALIPELAQALQTPNADSSQNASQSGPSLNNNATNPVPASALPSLLDAIQFPSQPLLPNPTLPVVGTDSKKPTVTDNSAHLTKLALQSRTKDEPPAQIPSQDGNLAESAKPDGADLTNSKKETPREQLTNADGISPASVSPAKQPAPLKSHTSIRTTKHYVSCGART